MRQRLIAEHLLYTGKATRNWACHSCGKLQLMGSQGYYYNIAHPCEMGRTICEPCVDALCLRLLGKAPPLPVPAKSSNNLFHSLLPWEVE